MDIKNEGLKAEISRKEFKHLLEVYSPCDDIEITYYIGSYYFSVDFGYWVNSRCVSFLTCNLENSREVAEFVSCARLFGYKIINLS